MLHSYDYLIVGIAAVFAGLVNALAGGGTLITYPVLVATGIPPIMANITNTVALCPGYFGATLAQTRDLRGQRRRLWLFIPTAILGGLGGAVLLVLSKERLFTTLVPFLILLASGLLAMQDRMRAWLLRRTQMDIYHHSTETLAVLSVTIATIYGGYFGAGVSVIVLAALGVWLDDSLTRLNALKQAISLGTNIAATVFFLFSGKIVWLAVLVMAIGALVGGAIGGRLAGRLKPTLLRWVVVSIGGVVGVIYLIRLYAK